MQVLVSVASKHGATAEIGRAIADVLVAEGVDVTLLAPDDVHTLHGCDAVVLGSAVYAGRWLAGAAALVDRERDAWAGLPVWIFSSGPVGEPPRPAEDQVDVGEIRERTGACDHRVFGGCLDRSRLGFAERALVVALRVPDGDYRPWGEIRAWASEIATTLRSRTARSGTVTA